MKRRTLQGVEIIKQDLESSRNRNSLPRRRRAHTQIILLLARRGRLILLLDTGATLQEAVLLSRAAALEPRRAGMPADTSRHRMALDARGRAVVCSGVVRPRGRRRQVRDILRHGVTRPNVGHAHVRRLAGLAERIITRVEVLAFLELVLQEILLGRHFAVQPEQPLLIRAEGANVDLVLLVRVHGEGAGSSAVYFAQRFRRSPALCGTLFGVAQRTLPFGDESIDRLD